MHFGCELTLLVACRCCVTAVHSSTLSIGSNSSAYSTVSDRVTTRLLFRFLYSRSGRNRFIMC